MSVAWPAALPMPQFGMRYNVVDPQRRTQMASGRTMVRRRFSDVPTEFSARWVLTEAEAEIFDEFYHAEAVDGTEWIEMPLVTAQGEGVHFVRFRGAYRYRRVGDDLWEYSAELQMYLRPASIEIPPGTVMAPPGVPSNAQNFTYVDPDGGWVQYAPSGYAYSVAPVSQLGNDYFGGWVFEGETPYGGQLGIYSAGSWANSIPAGSKLYVYFKVMFGDPSGPGIPSIIYTASRTGVIFFQTRHGGTGTNYYLMEGTIPVSTEAISINVSVSGNASYLESVNIVYIAIEPPP